MGIGARGVGIAAGRMGIGARGVGMDARGVGIVARGVGIDAVSEGMDARTGPCHRSGWLCGQIDVGRQQAPLASIAQSSD